MAARHLLPCPSCGHVNSITASQAGETITCSNCGATTEAPSLRGIRELPLDETAQVQKTRSSNWSHAQGVYFSLGLLSLIIGGVLCGIFLSQALQLRTELPELERMKESFEQIDQFTLDDSWVVWNRDFKDRPLGEWRESPVETNRRWKRALLLLSIPTGLMAVGGVASMIYSFAAPSSPRKRTSTKKTRR